ncbi:MAG: glycosyltransferase family 4 protein [bacterium]|nr:glycosyltransferase family 4 protein [bacterium]
MKKKVLIVGPTPPPYNGMSVVTKNILNSKAFNDEFEVLHLDTADRRSVENIGNLDIINIFLALKHFFEFVWILLLKNPEIIYIPISQNFLGYLRDSLFLIPAKIFRKKIIVHLHGGYFKYFYENTIFLNKILIKYTLSTIEKAIVLGECLREHFKPFINENKIFVVPNGVEDKYGNNIIDKDSFDVLFLSNLNHEKGVFRFLDLAKDIIGTHPNIRFICAGEWQSVDDNKKAVEFCRTYFLERNIIFTGRVSGKTKDELILKSSIFCMPTQYKFEGQPLVILEAMSAGLPIIAMDKGCIKETVVDKENGYIFNIFEQEKMRLKILSLYENKDLYSRFSKNSKDIFYNKFTKKIFIKNLINVMRGV